MVNFVLKESASPLSPLRVLAKGVATMFSAPALIMMKKKWLEDSERQRQRELAGRLTSGYSLNWLFL